MKQTDLWSRRRKRVYTIIDIGTTGDYVSRGYDFLYVLAIVVNLTASILYTYEHLAAAYGPQLITVEHITVAFFTVDYLFRLWTARYLHPKIPEHRAVIKYAFSFTGIVDILSFLPYYLPFFFPQGAMAFRIIRIVRILRLFRVTAYHDSLHIIKAVLSGRRQQLISSVFIILVLMLAASLCMYSLEHEAQPEVFSNAFSGMWWAVNALLTVGYGDIYPITPLGKLFGILLTFLGVGMVAIPTGIISAGFVDQYSRIKRLEEYAREDDINFMKVHLSDRDSWIGKRVDEIGLPEGMILAAIHRGHRFLIPRGDVVLQVEDLIILGAEALEDDTHIELKELVLKEHSPWVGLAIRDLDISRQSVIVLVERNKKMMIPNGNLVLQAHDKLILYTQLRLSEADLIEL